MQGGSWPDKVSIPLLPFAYSSLSPCTGHVTENDNAQLNEPFNARAVTSLLSPVPCQPWGIKLLIKMPFWYGPQTHREAPGSCIAIQHEIERQSPSTRQDELCAGAVSRAPVLGPVLHLLLAPGPSAQQGRLPRGNPAAQVQF